MSAEPTLTGLAARSVEAVQGILRMFAPDGVAAGSVDVLVPGDEPFAGVECPCVVAEAAYDDGIEGGSRLVIGLQGARRLAAAMSGDDPLEVAPDAELGDDEMAAVGDAVSQMMAASALTIGEAVGEQLTTAAPVLRRVADRAELTGDGDSSGHTVRAAFTFCDEPCLLIQRIPSAFIVRMTHAAEHTTDGEADDGSLGSGLRDVKVRMWAELGRTRLPSGEAVELPPGAVLELDRLVEDPVDVYVDGMRFATCRLVVLDDGALAMRLETIHGLAAGPGQEPAPAVTGMVA